MQESHSDLHLSTEDFANFPLQGFVPSTLYLVTGLLAGRCFLLNTQLLVVYGSAMGMGARGIKTRLGNVTF